MDKKKLKSKERKHIEVINSSVTSEPSFSRDTPHKENTHRRLVAGYQDFVVPDIRPESQQR
jgi:hypothetical protein